MSLSILYSRAQVGIQAPLVTVETHLSNGLPHFSIVGLPEAAVKESKDRVRSAILSNGFEFPDRRITINLAPADLPKDGGRFDLPIALGILAATKQINSSELDHYEFAGELALSGEIHSITGGLPLALGTRQAKRQLILPHMNADEASLSKDMIIYPAKHLLDVCNHLNNKQKLIPLTTHATIVNIAPVSALDMADVCGQPHARRALEIAAAGGHSLLFIGPPGTGKTMLSARLPTILPPLSDDEALEVAALASISARGFNPQYWKQRPFRSPHHTASGVALVGGGSTPRPGEISLAHHGVLFLDELPEFERRVLEVLREPLESGKITISRAARQSEFPANFQLVAAMNPCPCGYLGDPKSTCHCSKEQVQRYRGKLSGPLLDRIDMHIEVPALPSNMLQSQTQPRGESSAIIQARVIKARQKQYDRARKANHALQGPELATYCPLSEHEQTFIAQAMDKLGLSARAYHRILRVARTIADLAESDEIVLMHLSEAFSYRRLDRRNETF